ALLVLLLASPGWAYVAYRLVRQGPVPVAPAARDAYLVRKLPFYGAVRALNRQLGTAFTLYNLGGENLRSYVAGRMIGDWTSRHPYREVLPLLGEPEALDRKLAQLG